MLNYDSYGVYSTGINSQNTMILLKDYEPHFILMDRTNCYAATSPLNKGRCLGCSGPGQDDCTECQETNFTIDTTTATNSPFYTGLKRGKCECVPPKVMEGGFCVSTCSPGYVFNEATRECLQLCPPPKLNQNDSCVESCSPGKILSEDECLDGCQEGTILDPLTNKCKLAVNPCPSECNNCSGTLCLSCKNPDITKYLKTTCL